MGGKVVLQPSDLRRGGITTVDLLTIAVQGDDVPLAEVVAVVAFAWIAGGTSEVVEVSPRSCLHIVVIAGDGFGAVFLLAPGGLVTVGEVCRRSSRVGVITQGEDRAVYVGDQLCRSVVA